MNTITELAANVAGLEGEVLVDSGKTEIVIMDRETQRGLWITEDDGTITINTCDRFGAIIGTVKATNMPMEFLVLLTTGAYAAVTTINL